MSFGEGAYDILALPFPKEGVNTTIAPQTLPAAKFAHHLENIHPTREGTGSVRNGTVELLAGQNLPADARRLEEMPYVAADGTQQLLVYACRFELSGASGITQVSPNKIRFTANTVTAAYYVEDAPIKIAYTKDFNTRFIYGYVKGISLAGSVYTVEFYGTELPADASDISHEIYHSIGAIYRLNDNGTYALLKDNLASVCIPRFTQFMNNKLAGELVIVNGVNDNMRYDGQEIHTISDLVDSGATAITKTSPNSITFTPAEGQTAASFPVGSEISLDTSITGQVISSIVRQTIGGLPYGLVTFTQNHNFRDNTEVIVSGALQTEYNRAATVTVATANTFRYLISGTPLSPATLPEGGSFRIDVNNYTLIGIVQSVISSNNQLTIVFTQNILPGFDITITKVKTRRVVPPFSFIYSAHDRLWALGAGVPHPTRFREQNEAMRVYYCEALNSTTRWFNQATLSVPSIEISAKHTVADNLEAMAIINGGMAFFGREATQIWLGIDPRQNAEGIASFIWDRTLEGGCVHGNLQQALPNDHGMVTKYGFRTLSAMNAAQEFATSGKVGSPIESTIADQLKVLLSDRQTYLKARSFKYPSGRMLGMRIADTPLVYVLTDIARGWVFFSGDFKRSSTFCVDHRNRLLLGIGSKLYRYADGDIASGTLNWKDAVSGLIYWGWITPWIKPGKGRWANYRYEVIINPSVDAEFKIACSTNNNRTASLIERIEVTGEGGFFGTALFGVSRFGSDYKNPTGRLKFAGSNFILGISGETGVGPIDIAGIRLFGETER